MVNLPGSFNPNEGDVPEARPDFGMLPPGNYTVHMIEGDRVETDEHDPNFTFKATFEILDGPYKSRRLWHYFKLVAPGVNEMVSKIANDQLRAVCHAVNVLSPNPQSEMLCFRPLKVSVKAFPAGTVEVNKKGVSFTYQKDTNKITFFGPAGGGAQNSSPQRQPQAPQGGYQQPQGGYQAPQQSQPQTPARPAANVPPWQRKTDNVPF